MRYCRQAWIDEEFNIILCGRELEVDDKEICKECAEKRDGIESACLGYRESIKRDSSAGQV